MNALSYNTERPPLRIPEYGRSIQSMINYAMRIESREERNKAAQAIIDVMGQINPHLRDIEDYNHKLWTHLFIMSDFELDVDSPYPLPEKENLGKPPKLMKYPSNKAKYGHFGFYSEKIIKTISQSEDAEEKEFAAEVLGNLLKRDYVLFHTQSVENESIASYLKELSEGKIVLDNPEVLNSAKNILAEYGLSSNNHSQGKKKKKTKKRKR